MGMLDLAFPSFTNKSIAAAQLRDPALADEFNAERSHSALDYQTPADYTRPLTTAIACPAARYDSFASREIA